MKDLHMNLTQVACFVALADLASFTEAAERVSLTQSAVSHALAALERELGVTLIERNRKGVGALTPAGQAIMPHARALLAQADSVVQAAKAAQGRVQGRLRLGSTQSLCPGLLAGVLTTFQQQYPEIEVVLFEGSMLEVAEWIAHSVVDVGFVLLPARGMASTRIATDELCVLVGPGHPLRAGAPVSAADLRGETFIMAKNACSAQLLKMAGVDVGRIKAQLRYQASDSATILAMVREGLGVSVLPRMMLPATLEGAVALPLAQSSPLPIGLGMRSQELASPSARRFIRVAEAWAQARSA
jgi:DNA-binding transcriptional LysR family regulator